MIYEASQPFHGDTSMALRLAVGQMQKMYLKIHSLSASTVAAYHPRFLSGQRIITSYRGETIRFYPGTIVGIEVWVADGKLTARARVAGTVSLALVIPVAMLFAYASYQQFVSPGAWHSGTNIWWRLGFMLPVWLGFVALYLFYVRRIRSAREAIDLLVGTTVAASQ
jgi:hypothetical protein